MQESHQPRQNAHSDIVFLAAEVIHLTEVAKRVKTSEEAAMALDVAQQYVLRRANRQQHDGISPQTSYLILKASLLQVFLGSAFLSMSSRQARRAESTSSHALCFHCTRVTLTMTCRVLSAVQPAALRAYRHKAMLRDLLGRCAQGR